MSLATAEKTASLPPSAPPPERYWRRGDLATLFSVSLETVRNWQRQGRLPEPAVTIAGRAYWRPEDIRGLLDKQGADR
jgi:predicted site-specific integrase-resolvase